MRFTLIGLCAGTIMITAGASALFLPAFGIVGIAIDHNNRKTLS
ncbi:hypothetical protein [uncultured Corynebacterium sp.]|mgnify:CR=1 FL=1|nr:hypothetical protein [uncultured Corynebacterium sp.]